MTGKKPWPTVIAVDFDGTLCSNAWPEIGEPNWPIIRELIRRQADGDKIILWTCRSGELLDNAVLWCLNHGVQFDAINSNVPERIEQYGNDTRKVSADEYWDDRAVLVSGGNSLLQAGENCFFMQTLEETILTGAGRKEKGRPGNWIGRLWGRIAPAGDGGTVRRAMLGATGTSSGADAPPSPCAGKAKKADCNGRRAPSQ